MSDAKDSDGTFENILAAHDSVNWEKRLELARKQRAKMLAQKKGSGTTESARAGTPEEPADDALVDTPIQPILVEPRPDSEKQHGTISIGLVVLTALVTGAILGWGMSKLSDGWQEVQAMPTQTDVAFIDSSPPDPSKSAKIGQAPSEIVYDPIRSSQIVTTMLPDQVVLSSPPLPLPVPKGNPGYETTGDSPQPEVAALPVKATDQPITTDSAAVTGPEDVATQDSAASEPISLLDDETEQITGPDPPQSLEISLFVPSTVSTDASDRALTVLTEGQSKVVATARVEYSVQETHVRYYHPHDEAQAILVADVLGGSFRDFTQSGSKTPPGRIEVYLAGTGLRRQPQKEQREFEKFLARLIEETQ